MEDGRISMRDLGVKKKSSAGACEPTLKPMALHFPAPRSSTVCIVNGVGTRGVKDHATCRGGGDQNCGPWPRPRPPFTRPSLHLWEGEEPRHGVGAAREGKREEGGPRADGLAVQAPARHLAARRVPGPVAATRHGTGLKDIRRKRREKGARHRA